MNGPEKTLMDLQDQSLIERVCKRLDGQVSEVLVSANNDLTRFDFLNLPVVKDTLEGFAGPLAGILAGMRWAEQNSDHSWVLSVAADTPFFPIDLSEKMRQAVTGKQIALARSGGRNHPVFGLWHVSVANALEEFLVRGDRKVMLFVEKFSNCMVDFPVGRIDPFFNVNTPEDMKIAEQILSEGLIDD